MDPRVFPASVYNYFKRFAVNGLWMILIVLLTVNYSYGVIGVNPDKGTYLSPTHICTNPEANKLYISLSTAGKIAVVDARLKRLEKYIELPFDPGGLALDTKNNVLFVADLKPEGYVHKISLKSHEILKSYAVGHTPDDLAITPGLEKVFVANLFSNKVSVIDLKKDRVSAHIPVEREPKAIAVSEDGKYLAVANAIPLASADEQHISAKITLIDCNTLKVLKNFSLAHGSQSVEDVVFSKDGNYLYVSHVLSRNQLPTTQLKHGWMNTNALSIIDVQAMEYYTSVLLDNFDLGAANPSGMDLSEDGKKMFIALMGTHELCTVDLPGLHKKLDATKAGDNKNNRHDFDNIPGNLRFLYGLKERVALKGKSPRYVQVFNKHVYVSSWFSSELDCFTELEPETESQLVSLGNEPEMSSERRGELLFYDADLCFQKWQSCITCHPDVRTDGLNWDLLNDGAGNPKNTKSLLYSHFTPPAMITGIREKAEVAVRAGIKYIHFFDGPESDAKDIDHFLRSVKPVPSPYLVKGKLSEKARKGKQVFEKSGCAMCHSGIYFTNGLKYNVGTGIHPHQDDKFDTPGLNEVWRTAPYLYDGRAKTLKEVLVKFNPKNKHGNTSGLSKQELDDLVEYVMSL